jgi:glycosyltransferase involved in cell wall biosynthesis
MMSTTIVLCTYNRCERLEEALNSTGAQRFSRLVEWEVLVVDNNRAIRPVL